jgi:acyl carrier protein
MDKEEIINKINIFLVEEFEIEPEQLKPEALLKTDLGIDSLDFVDIIVIIEKNFGFKVKGEEMSDVKTLQDFYDYVIARVYANT